MIVTDSPLLLSTVYDASKDIDFSRAVFNEFNGYDNYNFLLTRVYPYESEGRYQTEEEAIQVDKDIKLLLDNAKYKWRCRIQRTELSIKN